MENIKVPQKPGIYKLTNKINGKIYIGKAIDLYNRVSTHKNRKTELIDRAIYKYGWENFDLEILQEYDSRPKDCVLLSALNNELLALETAFIDFYDSLTTKHGYNICLFGNDATGRKHTEESKRKMSECRIGSKHPRWGKKHSEDHKIKIAESLMGDKNHFYGKRHSKESKRKISEKAKQRYRENPELAEIARKRALKQDYSFNRKKIKQVDTKTNNVVKVWDSIKDAYQAFGLKSPTPIWLALTRRNKTSCGFKWEYIK